MGSPVQGVGLLELGPYHGQTGNRDRVASAGVLRRRVRLRRDGDCFTTDRSYQRNVQSQFGLGQTADSANDAVG